MRVSAKLVGNAGIYLGANIINAGIPFLLMPVLTRVLSPADYGTIAMFAIVLSVFGAFTGLSVHGAVSVRYFQLDRRELAEYVGTCVGILLASTAIVFLAVLVLGDLLVDATGVPVDWLLVAVVLSGFQFLGNVRLALWQASGEALRYGRFQIGQSLVNAVLSLLLILLVGMAWQGRLIGQGVAVTTFGLLAIYQLQRDELLKPPSDWKSTAIDALGFGLPLIPHVLGGLALAVSGQVVTNAFFGAAEAGYYAVAMQLGAVVGLLADAFVKVYGPWLYGELKKDDRENKSFIVGVTYIVFVFFTLASVSISFGLVLIIPYFLGLQFSQTKVLVPVVVIGYGLTGMYYAIAGFFFFTSNTKFISVVTLVSGCVMVAIMLVLAKYFGTYGVALGFVAGQLVMLSLAVFVSNRIYPMPWFDLRLAYHSVVNRLVRQ